MEPTDEQIKKFWERCGFEQLPEGKRDFHYELTVKTMNWTHPKLLYGTLTHLPRISLDNLFEYAVPLTLEILISKGYCPPIMKLFQLWYDKIVSLAGDSNSVQIADLALFWAIWEVIQNDHTG